MNIASLSFLRRVLLVDAIASGAMGVALVALATPLATLLALPQNLLRESGLVLLPFAMLVGYVASRSQPSRTAVWVIIAINAVWTIDSIVLLFSGWVTPNVFGSAFVIGQALVVGLFAELEYVGLRKQSRVAAQ